MKTTLTALAVIGCLAVPALAGAPLTSERPMPRPDYIGKDGAQQSNTTVTPLYLENWNGSRGKLYGWRVTVNGKSSFVSARKNPSAAAATISGTSDSNGYIGGAGSGLGEVQNGGR